MANHKLSLQKDHVYSLRFAARLKEPVDSYESASALAREVGVVEGTIRKWANGYSQPKIGETVKLAKALGVNLLWLATGEGEKYPHAAGVTREDSGDYTALEVDEKTLRRALEAVDEALALANREVGIERKAGMVSRVYAALTRAGGAADHAEVMRVIRSLL